MHEMAKNNALVRRMPAVETLGSVTVICSDKTGTITRGEMTVRRLYLSGGRWVEVSGVGYEPKGQFSLPPRDFRMALLAGLLCSDATLQQGQGRWLIKGDPTEGALVVLAAKAGLHPKELRLQHPRVEEVPFSSERKRMTTVHELQGRLVAFMKGAPEVVLSLCSHQEGGRALSSQDREQILKAAEQMASQGLRVLALAMRPLQLGPSQPQELEQQMHFLALVGMMDPPRQEAVESVRLCRTVGIRPVMITGDHKLTAMAVAREVGIYEEGELAISGQELQAMNEQEFARQVERISVYARVSPMDKLRIVRALKAKGHVVAMTGDGVNDAPALKHADIGVAMGITGTEVTKEAADMVLADDNFATIVKAIRQGRWIYDNIKKYLTFLLEANVAEILVLGGIAVLKGHEYLPLLPAAILYINLVTDGLPAIALGIAPPEPDIMERPPRDPRESVFSLEVRTFIFLFAAIYTPLFFWVFFSAQSILEARTEIFFLFVALELVIAMNLVSLRQSILRVRPFKWLIAAVLANVVLTAVLVQIPAVREAFGVGIPSLRDIEIVLALSAGVVLAMEAAKWWLRRRLQSPKAPKSLRST
jgi:Ca2+-transporting ATPase